MKYDGIDIETIVDLMRVSDRQQGVDLLKSTLKVAFNNGVIEGSAQMAKITDRRL